MRQNAEYVPVKINGWPVVLIVAIKDIAINEQVLIDYGLAFWKNHRRRIEPNPERKQRAESKKQLKEVRKVQEEIQQVPVQQKQKCKKCDEEEDDEEATHFCEKCGPMCKVGLLPSL